MRIECKLASKVYTLHVHLFQWLFRFHYSQGIRLHPHASSFHRLTPILFDSHLHSLAHSTCIDTYQDARTHTLCTVTLDCVNVSARSYPHSRSRSRHFLLLILLLLTLAFAPSTYPSHPSILHFLIQRPISNIHSRARPCSLRPVSLGHFSFFSLVQRVAVFVSMTSSTRTFLLPG